ncbi:MAG: aminotransferase class V-fold PLP-dependent enzyme, partial [Cyclobacteriaceae bacterium]
MNIAFTKRKRGELYELTSKIIDEYLDNSGDNPVTPRIDQSEIRERTRNYNFEEPIEFKHAIQILTKLLRDGNLHSSNPRYMGLFVPKVLFPGVIADTLTAAFNPNLGSWGHAPFPVEVETYLIEEFGRKFGYSLPNIDGVFTSGGAEANLNAVLCALQAKYSDYWKIGLKGRDPVIYCSTESHHSLLKAARIAGIGSDSVIRIESSTQLTINVRLLQEQIEKDIANKKEPLMIVGTAGTTGAGAFDDLTELSRISKRYEFWFHVDAAYGGALILNDELKGPLKGIELSDSITFDLHKWPAAPVGTSIFLTSNNEVLHKLFRISADYMPNENRKVVDPYAHSVNWSRRPIGLKVYLTLLMIGWQGYSDLIKHHFETGNLLRQLLEDRGWVVMNETVLPLICFIHPKLIGENERVQIVCDKLVESG